MRALIVLFFLPFLCFGQVGINTTSPNATLDIQSSNQATPKNTDGILIPKIDEYPLINPTATQDGMLVFATGNGSISKGFYYWNNATASWVSFAGTTIEKINDLVDGKSDNDGTDDGSSIFIGINAGLADDGSNNSNIAVGYESLLTNSIGYRNIAIGSESLRSNTSGFDNLAFGYGALFTNTTGFGNNAIGFLTLNANTDGDGNIAIGRRAMFRNTTGSYNVALGYRAMFDHTIGERNVAIGDNALENSTSSSLNTAIGSGAMETLVGGVNNIAVGANSLTNNRSGQENTALGANSLLNNLTGSGNAALGYGAGEANNGSNNVFLGTQSGTGSGATSSRLYIETLGATNPLVYGEFDTNLLRVNGDLEVEKPTDASITVKTPFGNKSSLKLFESGGADYGFEFQYDGSPDKLFLWSRTFAGNEGIRMTWLKDGKVGMNDTSPDARLDIEAIDPTTPNNTDGILIPRINAFPTTNPTSNQNGMLVFLTTDNTFYFWRNSTINWVAINTSGSQRINDLIDGKSDNSGSSVFLGIDAGTNDDGGNYNVGVGFNSLRSNISGTTNTAMGYQSLFSNTTGISNTAVGYRSLFSNTIGFENTAFGDESLDNNSTGSRNSGIGWNSLSSNTSGNGNTAVGWSSLRSNTIGIQNTSIGVSSIFSNISGNYNTAIGWESLLSNATGYSNSSLGHSSLINNTTGSLNTAVGLQSLSVNSTGSNNTAVGRNALLTNTTGNFNTAIGALSGAVVGNFSNTTAIGYNSRAQSPNSIRLGDATIAVIGGYAPWTQYSDIRVKTNIQENIVGLDFIKRLRPVSYNYNMDAISRFEKTPDSLRLRNAEVLKAQEVQTGFIAQEVDAAAEAAGFEFHGVVENFGNDGLYGLNYAEFVVPLVKAMQEQQGIIDSQQEDINALKREIEEIKALLRQD